jgi:hypothetical protein
MKVKRFKIDTFKRVSDLLRTKEKRREKKNEKEKERERKILI